MLTIFQLSHSEQSDVVVTIARRGFVASSCRDTRTSEVLQWTGRMARLVMTAAKNKSVSIVHHTIMIIIKQKVGYCKGSDQVIEKRT